MTSPTLWMVSGLHDPRWLPNVLENYHRQKYPNKRLIVVENGAGIGCVHPERDKLSILLGSEPGPAQPLNKALLWLRYHAHESDWFLKCDADDYYGPDYLASVLPAMEAGADYAGRSSLFIKTTEDRLWFVEGDPRTHIFHGPTLAGRISASMDFPVVTDWGEDSAWCEAMFQAGKQPFLLPPEGFLYQRWGEYQHTWPCTDQEIRVAWDAPFSDLGLIDFDIVNGIKRPKGESLGVAAFDPDQYMPLRMIREQLGLAEEHTRIGRQ